MCRVGLLQKDLTRFGIVLDDHKGPHSYGYSSTFQIPIF